MNKSHLITKLNDLHPKLKQSETKIIVDNIFYLFNRALADNRRIEIRRFGCFSTKTRVAGLVRNPRNGISLAKETRRVVYFRSGKELKQRVNRGNE